MWSYFGFPVLFQVFLLDWQSSESSTWLNCYSFSHAWCCSSFSIWWVWNIDFKGFWQSLACWTSSQNSLLELLVSFSNLFLHFSVIDSFVLLWVVNLRKDVTGVSQWSILVLTLYLLYISNLLEDFLRNIVTYDDDFPVIFPRCYKGAYVNSLLARIATLWNSFLVECFPLICDVSSFKGCFNKHLSCMGSFQTAFL